MIYDVVIDGTTHRVELTKGEKTWVCKVDDAMMEVDAEFTARDVMSILLGGKAYEIKRERALSGEIHMIVGSTRYASEVQDPRSLKTRRAKSGTAEGPQKLTAPMPGKIVRIMLPEKSEVEAGQGVIVVEAMKMQNELKSPKKGVVAKVLVAEGATVNAGDALVIIE
ncbi:MAG TPA: biotin/lipoyl-containing protein [Terriglobales bacterium]|nr:biotin/lipoyl-containing protein [Terriglobales bacterium]